jgi:hypothetical protein
MNKFISMIVVCVGLLGLVGCADMPSPSNDYADLDYNSIIVGKTLVIASDGVHSVYLYELEINDNRCIWYNGDKFYKNDFNMYAPKGFAEVGDIVGYTNGVYKVLYQYTEG